MQGYVEGDHDDVQGAGGREGAARPGRPGCCNCSIGQVVIIIVNNNIINNIIVNKT